MSKTGEKKDSGWRRRIHGTSNQIGQAFHLEPHGDRSKLPKALQQTSFMEIPDAIEKMRRKHKTPEEIAEDEMIDQAIEEAVQERANAEYQKNLLQKLGDALDKADKRKRLKKALEEAKAEQEQYEVTGTSDGYEDYQENLEQKRSLRDENEVFG